MTHTPQNGSDQVKHGDSEGKGTYPDSSTAPDVASHRPQSSAPVAKEHAPVEVYTPAEAAQILKVPESWLRKRAAARTVPCTFIGKHLRFTAEDLAQIVRDGAREVVWDQHSGGRGRHTARRKRRA